MEISTWEISSLVACFFLSGFFSGSEAILMSVGIDRAKQLLEEGGSRAKAMRFMIEKPNELLNTILVGNNLVNIWAASMTTALTSRYFQSDAVGIAVGITTLVILIFGEIIPKTVARTHAELLSFYVIRILQLFYYIMWPVITIFVWLVEKILGENAQISGRLITKDDIEYMVNRAEKEKTMDSKQLDLLNSILEFPKIKVKDIMIPRSQIIYFKSKMTFQEMMDVVREDTHTRYPVCQGDLDRVIGFLHVKDLLIKRTETSSDQEFTYEDILKKPFFVYEHMKIQAVFDHMNRMKVHLALVKDENNLVVGVVTLEDIIEEILGEIQDEHDEDEDLINGGENAFDLVSGILVEGSITLRDLYNDYDIKIPLNDNYSTLAGFILDMLGNNFPEEGQIIVWEGLSFELSSVDDYEIREVRIRDVDGEKHIFSKREASEIENEIEELEELEDKIEAKIDAKEEEMKKLKSKSSKSEGPVDRVVNRLYRIS